MFVDVFRYVWVFAFKYEATLVSTTKRAQWTNICMHNNVNFAPWIKAKELLGQRGAGTTKTSPPPAPFSDPSPPHRRNVVALQCSSYAEPLEVQDSSN